MKKLLLMLILVACCVSFSDAQNVLKRKCAADEIFQKQNKDPHIAQRRQMIEEQTREFMRRGGKSQFRTGVLTIPVVVHVIYNSAQENISDAQIQSQVDVLNEDFRKLNADVSNTPSEFAGLTSDVGIEFSLAGITRKQSSKTSWGTNDAMKKSSQGGVDPWDPSQYMNMWVCNIGGGILGYAQFPGGDPSTDGVVFSPQYCGSIDKEPAGENFYLSAPFDKGRTATHEVGHYLNLRHIWGDGNCNFDDFITDTPTASAPNYGCPSYPSKSCSSNGGYSSDMFMNYMDYVDDACMVMFSAGQKVRMDAIFEPGGAREGLGTSGPPCELAAPAGLASSAIGDNGFTLSWNAVTGAASYDVSVSGQVFNTTGTSYNVTGLTPGTDYDAKVRAMCSDGGAGPFSSSLAVTTTGSNCKAGPVTLTLVLDNYPSETSWNLSLNGSTVASGSGYSTSGATVTESFDYGDGDYTFTINDSYGDGICCSYGNGSYSLEDGNGNVIASGGSFASSESSSYCVEGSGGGTTPPPSSGTLAESYFETGWDGWSDGGSDVARYSGTRSYEGSYSIQLRDNSGTASAMTSSSFDVSSYDQVSVEFYFYSYSMENGEDFWLRYFDGSSWQTVAAYAQGTDFSNDGFYTATVTLDKASYNFPSNAQFRFQCDASGNNDYIYIDQVVISASSGAARSAGNTIALVDTPDKNINAKVAMENEGLTLFPNPTDFEARLHLQLENPTDVSLTIFDIQGRVMHKKEWKQVEGAFDQTVNVEAFEKGLYFINVTTADGYRVMKKLIVNK